MNKKITCPIGLQYRMGELDMKKQQLRQLSLGSTQKWNTGAQTSLGN